MTILTDSANHSCSLTLDGAVVGTLVYRLLSGRGIIAPTSVVAHGSTEVHVEFDRARITDCLAAEEGFITIKRRWEIGQPG